MNSNLKKLLDKLAYPILLICGPSGVGKSTLVKLLAKINNIYVLSVSYTTRELTEEEKTTKLYRQVSKKKFLSMIARGEFAEWNYYEGSDAYYGTTWAEIRRILKAGKVPAFDIDINGLLNLDKQIPRQYTYRLYLDVFCDEQERRIITRGRPTDTPAKIKTRLEIALKEKALMLECSAKDTELFSEIKDYNKAIPEFYANELINVLALHMKKSPAYGSP